MEYHKAIFIKHVTKLSLYDILQSYLYKACHKVIFIWHIPMLLYIQLSLFDISQSYLYKAYHKVIFIWHITKLSL